MTAYASVPRPAPAASATVRSKARRGIAARAPAQVNLNGMRLGSQRKPSRMSTVVTISTSSCVSARSGAENHTNVTRSMNLPFDATVHYVATHLHPFAQSLELRDLMTGESVYTSRARNFEDRIGLAEVDHYSSDEGFELYQGHEYELVSIYDNTSGEDQDSMAVMFLYLLDEQFERPREL